MAPRLIATGIPELLPMTRSGDPRRHISHVINKLCLALGHYERGEDDSRPISLMETGSAFQDAVATALAHRWAQNSPHRYLEPGELEKDGLIGTPDLYDVIDECIIEIKYTKISARHDPESEKFWKYWVQLKAYCYMMGVTKGRLHVGHVNGNYRDIDIVYNVWEDDFTVSDLWENWRMLRTNADKA